MKSLLALAIAVILGLLVFQGFQNRKEAVWRADRERILGEVAREKAEGDSLRKFAEGLQERAKDAERVAERNARMAIAARKDADSIAGLLNGALNGSDSATIALRALETLKVGYDSLQSSYDLLRASTASLRTAYASQVTRADLYKSSLDSVVALVGRVPSRSRFQPLLIVGAGATLSGGVVRVGPTVAIGVRIGL